MAMANRLKLNKDNNNAWIRNFEVTEPTRHRKGFTVYKVISTVFPKSFPESATKITVWKRYSDFRKLHRDLEQIFNQLYLKGDFPVFPKAKVFGRFDHDVIEERRKAALVLLEFTANHTQLFTSKAFNQFFENGYKSDDFIGRILFDREDNGGKEEPPATVSKERADIGAPCLEPEKVWAKQSAEEDSVSLSLSSISSSLSPENSNYQLPQAGQTSNSTPLSSTLTLNDESVTTPISTDVDSCTNPVETPHSSTVTSLTSSQNHNHENDAAAATSSAKSSVSKGNGIVRSATVTDDLSAYFEDEFEDAAFLFPMGSCASLDTLPGFTPSNDDTDSVHSKASSTSNKTGLFSLSRKKSGFGLFDFLPLFPKKSKNKKEKLEKEKIKSKEEDQAAKTDLLSVGYICEAAGHFAVAQFHESNMEFENAFNSYKEGIRVLLAGAQEDSDIDRKILAKNKLEKYLSRAESLKDMYLSPGASNNGTGTISPVFSSPNRKEKYLSTLNKSGTSSNLPSNGVSLLSELPELKQYKVVGKSSWESNVLIVMNPEEPSPKCYAVKVLWKSPCAIYPDKPTIIPCHIPFMAKLLKWFETSNKIILLQEYVGGGRLIDFVTNYQSKRISFVESPSPDESSPIDETANCKNDSAPAEEQRDDKTQVETFPRIAAITNKSQETNQDHPSDSVAETIPNEEALNGSMNLCNNDEVPESLTALPSVVIKDDIQPLLETEVLNFDRLDLDVNKLLENSKALLQTVTKTLEEGSLTKSSATKQENLEESKSDILKAPVQMISNVTPSHNETTPCQSSSKVINESRTEQVKDEQVSSNIDKSPENMEEPATPKRMVPDGCVRVWAAEMVLALEALHEMGITYGDLDMNDILLGENGHITLRYKSLWKEVDDPVSKNPCMAPEVRFSVGVQPFEIHASADWWSVGAILFWLLTGVTFSSAHPEGIFPEMIIKVPDTAISGSAISKSARSLLTELLQYVPELRLGYYGAAEIKTHPFFDGFNWDKATEDFSTDLN